jgi:outer membrane lipoprotein-sorting protein
MNLRKFVLFAGLFLYNVGFAADPAAVMKQSADRFKGAKYWSFDFQVLSFIPGNADTLRYKGEIMLGKNDQFHLRIPGQEYVSDGITLWQYTPSQKQVMVKNIVDLQGGMHPSEALFRYLKCKPVSMKDSVLEGVPVHAMVLDPKGQVKQFTAMTVWLKVKDQTPMRLQMTDRTGAMMIYKIANLRKDPPLKDADFHFVVPTGVEELDMR